MLNIDEIKNGLVIDHIQAGLGWKVFKWLGLDKAPYTTALVVNAQSQKTGKKDIIKIDNIINIDYGKSEHLGEEQWRRASMVR